jgi:HK97 family phage major capsid protein
MTPKPQTRTPEHRFTSEQAPRQTPSEQAPRQTPSEQAPRQTPREVGFRSLGEQLIVIRAAHFDGGTVDPRLVRAVLSVSDPSAGGFVISTQYARELVGIAYEEATIAPLCDRRETDAPLAEVQVPGIDETSRANGSRWGGTYAYWSTESAQVPNSVLRFKGLEFSGKKLIIVIVVANELFADVPMLETHVRRAFAAELGFALDLALLRGDGNGKPLGILNGPSLVTIAKETGQAAGTIVAENVRKMWSRMPAPSRRRCVWLINEDAEEQLEQMPVVIGTSGSVASTATALYMPAGAGGNSYALLKGRPVLVVEQCPALGTVGDIVLCDLGHYVLVDGGINPALSAHVKFLTDETVFRFTLRVDGKSAFASPITPYNGSANKRSPFVALAAR